MAASVSKINVVVSANTTQLAAGMNHAAATVQRSMGGINSVAQQATFAVDDFFAAFATGGVAGGLRGASNNLSMIAMQLGGIKTQLLVIGALAVGQLIASQFSKAAKEAGTLRDAIDDIGKSAAAAKTGREHARELTGVKSGRAGVLMGGASLDEVKAAHAANNEEFRREQLAIKEDIAIAEEKKNAARKLRGTALFSEGHEHKWSEETKKAITEADREAASAADAVEHRKKVIDGINKEAIALEKLREQRKLEETARQKAIADDFKGFQPFVTQAMRDVTKMQLEEVTDELNSRRGKLSMADMFRMMPGANAMGSSGAIGAINAAMSGPQNAQNAGVALQSQQAADIKRIRELEEKKKGLLEVVGL